MARHARRTLRRPRLLRHGGRRLRALSPGHPLRWLAAVTQITRPPDGGVEMLWWAELGERLGTVGIDRSTEDAQR
jgi:hypothetical protein